MTLKEEEKRGAEIYSPLMTGIIFNIEPIKENNHPYIIILTYNI